jgi:hypothetical protein
MIPCLSKTLFGLDCLGCGFQRSLLLILNGEFAAAFKIYPAIYALVLFLGIGILHYIDKHHNYKKLLIKTGIITGIFMIMGYIYKHF